MISLLEIKKYIQQQSKASQAMVAGNFNIELELANDLLLDLERRCKIQRVEFKNNCDSCQLCDDKAVWFKLSLDV